MDNVQFCSRSHCCPDFVVDVLIQFKTDFIKNVTRTDEISNLTCKYY